MVGAKEEHSVEVVDSGGLADFLAGREGATVGEVAWEDRVRRALVRLVAVTQRRMDRRVQSAQQGRLHR